MLAWYVTKYDKHIGCQKLYAHYKAKLLHQSSVTVLEEKYFWKCSTEYLNLNTYNFISQ